VEINNTDAEGRLVLGDGVAFAAKHLNPSLILDMATLTGAQAVATGKRHAAVVSNSFECDNRAVLSGIRSGELVHVLPYCPEFYRSEFASSMADMKNSVKDRSNAQASCAATFIASHLPSSYTGDWIHIDMAALALSPDSRATGYGVGLIVEYLGLTNNGQD